MAHHYKGPLRCLCAQARCCFHWVDPPHFSSAWQPCRRMRLAFSALNREIHHFHLILVHCRLDQFRTSIESWTCYEDRRVSLQSASPTCHLLCMGSFRSISFSGKDRLAVDPFQSHFDLSQKCLVLRHYYLFEILTLRAQGLFWNGIEWSRMIYHHKSTRGIGRILSTWFRHTACFAVFEAVLFLEGPLIDAGLGSWPAWSEEQDLSWTFLWK